MVAKEVEIRTEQFKFFIGKLFIDEEGNKFFQVKRGKRIENVPFEQLNGIMKQFAEIH